MDDMTTVGQILDLAISREAQAAEFYMAMADRITNPVTQKFFDDMVTEELEHKARLQLEAIKEG
ncbi:MAG: ferritin family protein, partial [Planctomycetota bacterium]